MHRIRGIWGCFSPAGHTPRLLYGQSIWLLLLGLLPGSSADEAGGEAETPAKPEPTEDALDPERELSPQTRQMWPKLRTLLDKIAERTQKQETLPDPSMWHPLREDKKSNLSKLNDLMEEALSHLGICQDFMPEPFDRFSDGKRTQITEGLKALKDLLEELA